MTSFGAQITGAVLKLYTYPYRKRHRSLSRSVKFKNKPYVAPKDYRFEVKEVCGTKIEILSPTKPNPRYAVVHFHGGGHTQAMNGTYRKVAERFCKISGCSVFSIDYQTGSGLEYPSVHNECFTAYVGLLNGLLQEKEIIAIGDSFGANLMLATCLKLRDKNMPLPCALISVSCYIDLGATGDSYKKNCYRDPLYALPKRQKFEENEKNIRRLTPYCGQTSHDNQFLSPAYAEFQGFPKMLIQCGDCETSESDSDILYQKSLLAGVDAKLTKYEGMWHDFQYLTPFLKESKTAWKEMKEFLDSVLPPERFPY